MTAAPGGRPDPPDPAPTDDLPSATRPNELITALGRLIDGTSARGDVGGVQYLARTQTRCLIPDLDDELVDALAQVEEVLLRLAAWEEDNADRHALDDHAHDDRAGPLLPVPLAGHVALDALNRVQDAVVPTQTRTDHAGRALPPTDPAAHTRLYGPDGHHQHRPLRLVTVARSDLDTLAAAARELGHALATRPGSELADALRDGVQATLAHHPRPASDASPAALVETLTRAHGLLDLADDADPDLAGHSNDTATLRRRLAFAAGSDVVLTAAEEAAYQRLAGRAYTMWTSRDPLAGWLY